LLGQLKNLSNYYAAEASAFIAQADEALRLMRPPELDDIKFSPIRQGTPTPRLPRPPTLTGFPVVELPKMGELTDLIGINERFTETPPTLSFPNFIYPTIATPALFTESAPEPTARTINPAAPTLEVPDAPIFVQPQTVTAEAITGSQIEVPKPVFTEFTGDYYTEYEAGLAWVAGDIASWHAWLNALRPQLAPAEQALSERLRQVLVGEITGLTNTWENQSYDQARQDIVAARRSELEALDFQSTSVTGLPSGANSYTRLETELKALKAITKAAAGVADERREREAKHLQWAFSLATRMSEAALALRSQEAGWRMKGLLVAMEGAKGALDTAVKVLALEEKKVAIQVRYNEAQLRRAELSFKFEQTKLESLRIALGNNELVNEYNQHQIQAYRAAQSIVEARITLYRARIDLLVTDSAWRKLALQAYESDINAYKARLKLTSGQQSALTARIKGDLARTEGELGKLRAYEAELKAESAVIKSQATVARTQALQNQYALEEAITTAEAQLKQLAQLDTFTKQAVVALVKGFDAETSEQSLKLRDQEIADRETLQDELADLQYEHMDAIKVLREYSLQLEQAVALGKVLVEGAGTVGGIAKQAFASLNGIGATEIAEAV
jgi:helix-turn-helix protein